MYNNITMEYQKIKNLWDNASNKPSKFRTKNWVERNDESREGCNADIQIKFKTAMLKPSLCDYSDTYILAKWSVTVDDTSATSVAANNTNEKVLFKNYAPFK